MTSNTTITSSSNKHYCVQKNIACGYANITGYCTTTACYLANIPTSSTTSSSGSIIIQPINNKHDTGKPVLSHVPVKIIYEIEKVRGYGIKKYHDPDNWKTVDVDRYKEALLRHVLKIWENGVDAVDPESGLLHLSHAACNIAFILEMIKGSEPTRKNQVSIKI